ncbi:MAG TPA: GNAT family N-acetyltransferase [Longimicrobiaceae bacterium]|nr:GNAT family N-acetyltransferase [Longimicrobiaceae bacterium]
MTVEIRLLGPREGSALQSLAPEVFDHPVDPRLAAEFLAHPRHHLAVALDRGTVVGMASGVHYVHPDKRPQLFINEVGVSPGHRGRGVGRRLVRALCDRGNELGCTEAWVLTDPENAAARRMYAAAGGEESPPQVMVTFPLGGAAA